jgi:hypothetical protein
VALDALFGDCCVGKPKSPDAGPVCVHIYATVQRKVLVCDLRQLNKWLSAHSELKLTLTVELYCSTNTAQPTCFSITLHASFHIIPDAVVSHCKQMRERYIYSNILQLQIDIKMHT